MPDRRAYGQPQVGNQGFARTMKTLGGRIALGVADLATGRTTGVFVVPKGFVVTGIIAIASDMDTNGTATLTLSVGDAALGTRFLAASTIGQAGTTTQALTSAGLLYEYTADTEIVVTTTAGAATAAAGLLDLYLVGFMK